MTALLMSALAAAGFSLASLLALFGRELGARGRSYATAAAAGILLSLAFVDLFPEGLEIAAEPAISGFVAGFVFLFLTESLFRVHTHHSAEEPMHKHALGPFILGLAIHNLADGFVLGVGARAEAVTSWVIGIGILVHQVPVGISLAAVLTAARATRARVAWITVSLGLAIPIAAGLTILLPSPGEGALGFLTGAAGGVLAYVGAAHLLPEARSEYLGRATGAIFAATFVATTIGLMTILGD
ncbi:MAG: ZIP family metal transporter [Actinomycetota bacterium]|nr:ZIP family metal transporter [Actinomycetota bacterium]